jgi:hypothetical protein
MHFQFHAMLKAFVAIWLVFAKLFCYGQTQGFGPMFE